MSLVQAAEFAADGVTANKLRSALTTLGILIGVAAVIILVAVGTGSSRSVQASIDRLGSNALTVISNSSISGGRGGFAAIAALFRGRSSGGVTSGTKSRAPQL